MSKTFKPRMVIGTPITPARLLKTLKGSSFCVSFYRPDDVADCMRLVGKDEILMLDNGAFSHWKNGGAIDVEAFWHWANTIQGECPNAVAVIPDVITGTEEENLHQVALAIRGGLAWYPERTMAIWHLNESLDYLERLCRLVNFVGFGSSDEYDVQRHRDRYLERVSQASAVVDRVEAEHNRRPWIHLMRGLGIFPELVRFESADSTNVALNHYRHRDEHGDNRAAHLAGLVRAKILAGLERVPVETVVSEITNFADPPTLRPCLGVHQAPLFQEAI